MRIGSLFSGIGGLELGLERAGVGRTVWQVEQDPYCLGVLTKHWPNALRYTDVREVGAHNLPPVDVICGGFPCQDISDAGKRAGITGERSGLWFEYARIVRELRPRLVVVENVRALLVRGIDVVLGDLATAGYDAEWDVLSAADVGAPHLRERVFIIAWSRAALGRIPDAKRDELRLKWQRHGEQRSEQRPAEPRDDGKAESLGNANGIRCERIDGGITIENRRSAEITPRGRTEVSNADGIADGRSHAGRQDGKATRITAGISEENPDTERERLEGIEQGRTETRSDHGSGTGSHPAWWAIEPDVGRVAHGVPARVDRLRALGNAVVPQCAEVIGGRLLEINAQLQESAA